MSFESEDGCDQFSTFGELYDYVTNCSMDDDGKSVINKLPQYIDHLFKSFNLYQKWNTATDIDEETVEILLHLKIELKDLLMTNRNRSISDYSEKLGLTSYEMGTRDLGPSDLVNSTDSEQVDESMIEEPLRINYSLIQKEINTIDNLAEKFGFVQNGVRSQAKKMKGTGERTDTSVIPESQIHCLKTSVEIMNMLIRDEAIANEHNDVVFNNPKCYPANKTLKSTNCYGLDRLGIVIRREYFNSKSKAFSWKYLEGTKTPISYFYDPILSDEENINQILSRQYQLQPTAFTKPSGVIYKIYSRDPELAQRYINFINLKNA